MYAHRLIDWLNEDHEDNYFGIPTECIPACKEARPNLVRDIAAAGKFCIGDFYVWEDMALVETALEFSKAGLLRLPFDLTYIDGWRFYHDPETGVERREIYAQLMSQVSATRIEIIHFCGDHGGWLWNEDKIIIEAGHARFVPWGGRTKVLTESALKKTHEVSRRYGYESPEFDAAFDDAMENDYFWGHGEDIDGEEDREFYLASLGVMAALSAKGVRRAPTEPPEKLNRRRAKRGRCELFSYYNLMVDVPGQTGQARGPLGHERHSPRPHWRMGHLRRRPGEAQTATPSIIVPAAFVGFGNPGGIAKDYRVRRRPPDEPRPDP